MPHGTGEALLAMATVGRVHCALQLVKRYTNNSPLTEETEVVVAIPLRAMLY